MPKLPDFVSSLEDRFFSLSPYIRQLKAENNELNAKLTAAIAGELTIESIYFKNGRLSLSYKTKIAALIAQHFFELTETAANYVECSFYHEPSDQVFLITAQKSTGKSPHQLRLEAESQRDEAIAKVAALEKELEMLRKQNAI